MLKTLFCPLLILIMFTFLSADEPDITISSSIRKGKTENWESAFFDFCLCDDSSANEVPEHDVLEVKNEIIVPGNKTGAGKKVNKIKLIKMNPDAAERKEFPDKEHFVDVSENSYEKEEPENDENYFPDNFDVKTEADAVNDEDSVIKYDKLNPASKEKNNIRLIKRKKERGSLRKNNSLIKSNH